MMKSVFCLALVCSFVAGALAGGCGCDLGVFDCACKNANDEVIKARVLDNGVPSPIDGLGNGMIHEVNMMMRYLGDDQWAPWDVKYVYISKNCDKTLKKGERYILMGRYNGNDMPTNDEMVMELHAANALAKVQDNVKDPQMEKLRHLRDEKIECP